MFISTAILQNRELSYQREDVKLNRQSLEKQINELQFQRGELEKQTNEFQKTNKYNNESLEITQFFEMLRLREETYNTVLDRKSLLSEQQSILKYYEYLNHISEDENYIVQFNLLVKGTVLNKIAANCDSYQSIFDPEKEVSYEDKEMMKINYDILLKEKPLLEATNIDVHPHLVKLYTYNKILGNLVYETDESTTIFSGWIKSISESFKKAFQYKSGERYKRSDIYKMIVSEPEEELRKIIDNEMTFEEILKMETR